MTTPRNAAAIRTESLRKSYGDKVVLAGIDLDIPGGSVFALLGPNGAGKTTVVHILSTLIAADGGQASVLGHDVQRDPDAVRAVIGVTGQFSAVDNLLTGRENLLLMADLQHLGKEPGRRRAAELLEQFELAEDADMRAEAYSGGMRRRLDLAMTLIGKPKVIFLDEPTTGLDPRSRRAVWQVVRDLAAQGVTIFLTTQYMEEADHLADSVAVLDSGGIVARGTPEQLKRQIPGGQVVVHVADLEALVSAAATIDGSRIDEQRLTLHVPSDGTVASVRAVLSQLDEAAVDVDDIAVTRPALDDVFLALTGKPIAPSGPIPAGQR